MVCCDLLEVGVDSCLVLVRDLKTASDLIAIGHIVGCLPYASLANSKYLGDGLLPWCCLFVIGGTWITHFLLLLILTSRRISALKGWLFLQLALIISSIALVNLLLFDSLVMRIFMDMPEGFIGFGGSARANCVISAIGILFLTIEVYFYAVVYSHYKREAASQDQHSNVEATVVLMSPARAHQIIEQSNVIHQ